MKKVTMGVLIFFIFANPILLIFGKVIIMRKSLLTTDNMKLICVSEDDGGALVWNLLDSYPNETEEFSELNGFNYNEVNCKMNANEGCLKSWTKQEWNLTNSLITPMGPVFDQRWEEFEQHENWLNKTEFFEVLRTNFSNEVKLSFSIRTFHNMQILICNGKNIYNDSCYWIIIDGWDNTQSVIQKYVTEVAECSENDSKCYKPLDSYKHTPVSKNKWRSFVITWNFDMGKIIVYDTDKIILTYTDDKRQLRSNNNYYMFFRSPEKMFFRLHIYDFLHTTVENATLRSPVFLVNNKVICVQLLVGLCAECDAHIVLRDPTNDAVLVMVIIKGSTKAAVHRLPMWQSVTIKNNSINYSNYKTVIQLIPKLNNRTFNPLWAIANIRQCPQNGALRKGVITFGNDDTYANRLLNVTCQKLFYNEHAVVSSLSRVKSDVKLDESNCPLGKIGPQCLFSCEDDLHSNNNCGGTEICYEDGCTCAEGFTGKNCLDSCDSNTYGYDCKKTCGLCLYNETLAGNRCDKITGKCSNGCNNTNTEFYVPPLCKTSVEKPNAPMIISINETTIGVSVPITWKDEYEEISIFYSLNRFYSPIEEYSKQPWKKLFRNMTQVTKYFDNLRPGIIYRIRLSLNISGMQIHSDWRDVATKCNPAEIFVIPEETSIVINLRSNPKQLHLCPENDWYYLTIFSNNRYIHKNVTLSPLLTWVFYALLSNSVFNVTIFHENRVLFSKEICTLESVPSEVSELKSILSAGTPLTLIWKPPHKPNGKIVGYQVFLKVNEYYGCTDLKLHTMDNNIIMINTTEPTITISDLHPYTSYSAQVMAYNSRYLSSIAETTFNTTQSEIISGVYSQLNVHGWILTWPAHERCPTTSRSLFASVTIRDIGNNSSLHTMFELTIARNFVNLRQLQLIGQRRYSASLIVRRNNNNKEEVAAVKTYEFETPPTAPPKVTNLEVVEIDTRHNTAMIYLRWQSPVPPFNGKLRIYGVQLCNKYCSHKCSIIEVPLNKFCDLWDAYICEAVQMSSVLSQTIKVFAYNVNVPEEGLSVFVAEDMLNNTTPDAPGNYTFTINNNSVIDLKWLHPWKTGGPLKSFLIRIQVISTNLRFTQLLKNEIIEYPVTQYMRKYSKRLYLFPSTQYKIHIQAVTVANKSSNTNSVEINTPSAIVFDGILEAMEEDSNSMILINIPSVSNDTQNSMLHIIVKGPSNTCERFSEVPEDLRALISVKTNEIAWQAAEVSTKVLAGGQFKIGDNKIYGNALNCPLKPDFYEIAIIVTEQNSTTKSIMLSKSFRVNNVSPTLYEAWIIPITSFFIVTAIASYLYRRKRQRNENQIRNEIVLSQESVICEHEMKSTISNGIELMEDLPHFYEIPSSLRATTPEALINATTNGNEEEAKTISLVKVKDFEEYVKQGIKSGLLDKQYKTISKELTPPCICGKLPLNKCKNRHDNLVAYDKTRLMKKHPDDTDADHINGNYITGYKKEKRYIATKGPELNTVIDFWRMIWQENVLIICMLTNIVENEKYAQYWPDIDKKMKYGDIIVLNEKQNIFADYSFRTFQVTYGEDTREIEHLHYTAWPDREMPLHTHSVVTYLKKLLLLSPGDGPVVVHCSDGVGRTGIIILCDICLHRAAAEGEVDVYTETASIRSERANMVDNKQQYLFAHLVLVECLFSVPTTLPCNEMLIARIKELKKQLPAFQQRLQDTAWQDKILRQDKFNRVYLKKYPTSDEDSDYLSAVYVDGVNLQNEYLATQLPMPSTINTFWRMVAEYKVELILVLQPPDCQDPTCCEIASASGEFKPTPYLNITVKKTDQRRFKTQKLLLVDNFEKPPREQYVTIFYLTEWTRNGRDQPPHVRSMVCFWNAAKNIARGNGPIVTLCHDGVTVCGLYLALSFLLERMAVEKECDVYLAVQTVKRSRTDFVRSLEHLEYLYDAAMTYFSFFENYANFL